MILSTPTVLLRRLCSGATLFAFFLAGQSFAMLAQASVQEPQYIGQFEILAKSGTLTPLEQAKMTHQSKTKNHFISVSSTSEEVVPGGNSPVRVSPDAHFIVKTSPGSESIDPNTVIAMKPFLVEKDQRGIVQNTAKAGMFQGVKSGTAADNSIALTFKKYGASSLEIVPAQPLPPGEYVLLAQGGAMGVYCFGVDAH